jgi:hypothetical protein
VVIAKPDSHSPPPHDSSTAGPVAPKQPTTQHCLRLPGVWIRRCGFDDGYVARVGDEHRLGFEKALTTWFSVTGVLRSCHSERSEESVVAVVSHAELQISRTLGMTGFISIGMTEN